MDSLSSNTWLIEVMISLKNEYVFLWHLSDLTLQIISNAWWPSVNVGSKRSIALKNFGHRPFWWCYLHCGIEAPGSTGFICIICPQVLRRPSEDGTSSMRKHLLAHECVATLNKLPESAVTEFTSSMVDEWALAILKREGSQGITIVSLQWKFIFDI